jgi:hypothetical protein
MLNSEDPVFGYQRPMPRWVVYLDNLAGLTLSVPTGKHNLRGGRPEVMAGAVS